MIAADGQHGDAGVDDGRGVGLDALQHAVGVAEIESHIAVVDDRQAVERVEAPGPNIAEGKLARGGAHPGRPEPSARAVAGRQVEGYAADRYIDAG